MREQLLQESGGGVCLQPGGEEGHGTPPGAESWRGAALSWWKSL